MYVTRVVLYSLMSLFCKKKLLRHQFQILIQCMFSFTIPVIFLDFCLLPNIVNDFFICNFSSSGIFQRASAKGRQAVCLPAGLTWWIKKGSSIRVILCGLALCIEFSSVLWHYWKFIQPVKSCTSLSVKVLFQNRWRNWEESWGHNWPTQVHW